jgi:hypothetical protein
MKHLLWMLLTLSCAAQTPVVITGTITDTSNNVATSGYIQFDLVPTNQGFNYNIPPSTVVALSSKCAINASGQPTLYPSGSSNTCVVWPNDLIIPSNTLYKVTIAPNNKVSRTYNNVLIKSAVNPQPISSFEFVSPQSQVVGTVVNGNPLVTMSVIPATDSVWTVGDPQHKYACVYTNCVNGGPIGGGGTPGGNNSDVQFNNAGTFGGDDNFNWLTTNESLMITGGPVAANITSDLADTGVLDGVAAKFTGSIHNTSPTTVETLYGGSFDALAGLNGITTTVVEMSSIHTLLDAGVDSVITGELDGIHITPGVNVPNVQPAKVYGIHIEDMTPLRGSVQRAIKVEAGTSEFKDILGTTLTLSGSAGSGNQCLRVNNAGLLSGTGSDCSPISNINGTAEYGDILRYNIKGDNHWAASRYTNGFGAAYAVYGGGPASVGIASGLATSAGMVVAEVPPTQTRAAGRSYSNNATASVDAFGIVLGQDGNSSVNFPFLAIARTSFLVKLNTLTNSRYWFGLGNWTNASANGTNGTAILGTTKYATDTPNSTTVGFRYSDGTDTTFKAVTIQAAGISNVVDTGVTADTNPHLFEFVPNFAGTAIAFLIDGNLVATISSNLPNPTPANQREAFGDLFVVTDNKNTNTASGFSFYYMECTPKW